ncbi:LCP family protein [Streptomyces kanamyceticus]|uniref:LytR family transcriptional regulator n=1 Tax=Streptomyces kanamyceticus TaxID=1967 RepID=A0A5J6GEA1_STRKN|nr:LCP family protein [Streptomyces kanamyceticus]QEU93859.1 LytR family transcriptional regulator [Streptomyces kanamyceticus]
MADGGSRSGKRRWPKRVALSLLALVVLLAAYGTGLYFWAGSRLRTTDAFAAYEGRPERGKGTDWLLVGSDSRSSLTPEQRKKLHVGNDQGLNTDTIMVLHYGDSGPYLVSIPRDSYVSIPGHGKGKINSAYAIGGATLLTRTVEQATGLRIDHYAEVNFLGFVDVVDALGGVSICVPEGGLHDEKSGADFDGGCQHMDGVEALRYVRARYSDPEGDLGRVKRQRQLVSAVAEKAVSVPVLLPPWKLIPFLSASLDALTVDTDTGVGALTRMGLQMEGLSSGSGATTTVPVASEPEIAGVGDVVVWDQVKAGRLFEALRDDTPIPTSGAN